MIFYYEKEYLYGNNVSNALEITYCIFMSTVSTVVVGRIENPHYWNGDYQMRPPRIEMVTAPRQRVGGGDWNGAYPPDPCFQ